MVPFADGDIVVHKDSPHLRMTVLECKGDRTRCAWIDEADGQAAHGWFDSEDLQWVDTKQPGN